MPDRPRGSPSEPDDGALFTFDGVTVRGDRGDRLAAVDAAIPSGGITCLLGPSGAGKSTLLRLCNRLEVADEGCVRFRGRDLADEDPLELRRRVGMVFQRPTVFPGTVRENLQVATPDASEEQMVEALGRADLGPAFLDAAHDELSGGEAQRVCVARTLVTDPEALLMDEPTSALDPTSRLALEQLARRLADEGAPIVWVTHDLAQAERVADLVLVLRDGRVAQTGTMEQIRSDPAPGVAAFLEGRDDGDGGDEAHGKYAENAEDQEGDA